MIIGGQLSQASSPYTSVIMGASFGLALTLVIFAGADLFTGNNMFFTISTLDGLTSVKDTIKIWFWCYIGNFLGAAALCLVVMDFFVSNTAVTMFHDGHPGISKI
ncbi:formate/nitrite transporter family protein [Neobacillus sp. 179-J 1A1 HS]|uniref:formate/nitrite transporter family protein n=1 Tax=Neobacillus driksii TaxID=3035913 RepID=UPI0035BBA67D